MRKFIFLVLCILFMETLFSMNTSKGKTIRVEGAKNVIVVYSNLDEKKKKKKGQEVTEGQVLGTVGNTTSVESEDGTHVHVEAFKGEESIDPMTLLK